MKGLTRDEKIKAMLYGVYEKPKYISGASENWQKRHDELMKQSQELKTDFPTLGTLTAHQKYIVQLIAQGAKVLQINNRIYISTEDELFPIKVQTAELLKKYGVVK
jgi:DNA-binding NarL/FixJ family response regulator